MASYNLNEALKKKAAPKKAAQQEIKLDDVSRVKVLSPGRQVFKRFIRNGSAADHVRVLVHRPAVLRLRPEADLL